MEVCQKCGSEIGPSEREGQKPAGRNYWLCSICDPTIRDTMYANRGLERGFFSKIQFKFENELEALVEIDYSNSVKSKVRLFFGKEGKETIYSRDYLESSTDNFVHIKILPSRKQYSTQWIKKGTHDVGDNFEAGYTIEVLLRFAEPELRKYLINVLSSNGFGCMPSARTIHAHRDDNNPNEDKAKKILRDIVEEIAKKSENS